MQASARDHCDLTRWNTPARVRRDVAARAGSRRNPQTDALLKQRNIPQQAFASRQISEPIVAAATHVFAMTRSHLDILEERFPAHSSKFYLMCEFADIPELGIGVDVPDPIGLGPKAYEEVAEMFEFAIPAIIEFIDQTWKPADR